MRLLVRHKLLIAIGCWVLCIAIGLGLAIEHDTRPAVATNPPVHWPTAANAWLANRSDKTGTLLLFVHPHCPCAHASLGEFTRLVSASAQPLNAQVIFVKSPGTPVGWERTELWNVAASMPSVTTVCDQDGRLADLFHASSSGQTLLYDIHGDLVFQGGVTAARGHVGPNAASNALLATLNHQPSDLRCSPVFGCPLIRAQDRSGASQP